MTARRASEKLAHGLLSYRLCTRQSWNAASPLLTATFNLRRPVSEEPQLVTRECSGGYSEKLQWKASGYQAERMLSPSGPRLAVGSPGLKDSHCAIRAPDGGPKKMGEMYHVLVESCHRRLQVRNLGSQGMSLTTGHQKEDDRDGAAPEQETNDFRNFLIVAEEEFKRYLIEVKRVSALDADFISENYPTVGGKIAAFLRCKSGLKNQRQECASSEELRAHVRDFIASECEGERAWSGEISPPGAPLEFKTLGDMLQLSNFPLAFTGNLMLLKSMAVLNSLGWSRQRLVETSDRNPLVLTWTAEELQARIFMLERIGVKNKDIVAFVEDSSICTLDLDERLAPLLQYLAVTGIQADVLGDLFKFNPQGLIKMPVATFKERVDYLLDLGLSSCEVERCMRMFPQLVHLRLSNLTQKVQYFESLGVGREGVARLVAKLPSIFRHSIKKNLSPKIQMLRGFGVLNEDLVRIMGKYPQFFGCSMENLNRKLAFFQRNGLTGARLVKLIVWHPRAFSFSIQENLMKKLLYLSKKGFEIGSIPMVRAMISCVTISTSSLEARFQNLVSLGFSDTMVREIIKKQPAILCLSEKTVRVKVDYLLTVMERPLEEVLKCPGFLLYGLESRIKPRHRVMVLLGFNGPKKGNALSLSTILQPGEKTFERRYVNRDSKCFNAYYINEVGENCHQEQGYCVEEMATPSAAVPMEGDIRNSSDESSSDQEMVAM